MYREKVVSSIIHSIGYDARDQILEIEFSSAEVYQYVGVPGESYQEMLRAESHGRYFNENIRDAGYLCQQV